MAKYTLEDGTEVEAFSAEEVRTQIATATATEVAKKEAELKPQISELTEKLGDAEKRATERAGEFAQFRKLSDEAVAKLSVAERTIYENGVALAKAEEDRKESEKTAVKNLVAATIKAKAGTNEALTTKMNEMWPIIGIEATTPEQIEQKALMVLGALSTIEPDLVASAGVFTGAALPPKKVGEKEGESFADTERGKAAGKELGLTLEVPKT